MLARKVGYDKIKNNFLFCKLAECTSGENTTKFCEVLMVMMRNFQKDPKQELSVGNCSVILKANRLEEQSSKKTYIFDFKSAKDNKDLVRMAEEHLEFFKSPQNRRQTQKQNNPKNTCIELEDIGDTFHIELKNYQAEETKSDFRTFVRHREDKDQSDKLSVRTI